MYDIEARFTVKNMKSICSAVGLPISGTKGILQQRLRTYFEQLAAKQDSIRFNIAKTAAESERGCAYGFNRYHSYSGVVALITTSRPANGFRPAGTSSTVTPSQTNTWGMSPLYQNIRLRMTFCDSQINYSCLQEDALLHSPYKCNTSI